MKASKVLGVVFGALLVAVLFTGAVAADDVSLGDVTIYKLYKNATGQFENIDLSKNATWTGDSGSVTFLQEETSEYYYIAGENIVPGKYYKYIGEHNYFINVKYPSADITGYILENKSNPHPAIAQLIGGTVDTGKLVKFNNVDDGVVAFTNPDKTLTSKDLSDFGAKNVTSTTPYEYNIEELDLGVWTVQAVFEAGTEAIGTRVFSKLAPEYMYGEKYYFTVVKENTDASISTVDTEIIQGGYATIVIEAPKGTWKVTVDKNGDIPLNQPGVTLTDPQPDTGKGKAVNVSVPVSGIFSLSVKAVTTSNIKVSLYELNEDGNTFKTTSEDSLTIKVKAGAITAGADVASVYIGNEVDISGTNDLGGNLYFYLKGTNYDFKYLEGMMANGKEWTETLDTAKLKPADKKNKRPDAGTYTVYVVSLTSNIETTYGVTKDKLTEKQLDNSSLVQAYTTVSLALKQPFLTITSAPEVVTHGDKLVVKGTAEGNPENVKFYIFGTNKFISDNEPVESDGTFEISKKIIAPDTEGDDIKLAAGQYFLVIQHAMYDGKFNIGPVAVTIDDEGNVDEEDGYNIMLNESGEFNALDELGETLLGKVIFNTNERQSANAAEALCRALDSQNIDDMYVKASFIVAGATSYIDPVPTSVTKGQVLTVSGTTTGHKDDVVVVELLSTAFAAVPKEAVGSASFVALSTKIGADGVWSVSFDTSNLNADEYTCSVAVGQLDATTSKITIVEGAGPQPTETTPVNPTAQPTAQPTATPATPGFGALAALAGLGAVAVLLLRRQ